MASTKCNSAKAAQSQSNLGPRRGKAFCSQTSPLPKVPLITTANNPKRGTENISNTGQTGDTLSPPSSKFQNS